MLGGNGLDGAFIALVGIAVTISFSILAVNVHLPREALLPKVCLLCAFLLDSLLTIVSYYNKSLLATACCATLTITFTLMGIEVTVEEPLQASKSTFIAGIGILASPVYFAIEAVTVRLGLFHMMMLSTLSGMLMMIVFLLDTIERLRLPAIGFVSVDVFPWLGQDISSIVAQILATVLGFSFTLMTVAIQVRQTRQIQKRHGST